jgi:hypothetical protein
MDKRIIAGPTAAATAIAARPKIFFDHFVNAMLLSLAICRELGCGYLLLEDR